MCNPCFLKNYLFIGNVLSIILYQCFTFVYSYLIICHCVCVIVCIFLFWFLCDECVRVSVCDVRIRTPLCIESFTNKIHLFV